MARLVWFALKLLYSVGRSFYFELDKMLNGSKNLSEGFGERKIFVCALPRIPQAFVQSTARCTEWDTPSHTLRIYVLWQSRPCLSGWEFSVSPWLEVRRYPAWRRSWVSVIRMVQKSRHQGEKLVVLRKVIGIWGHFLLQTQSLTFQQCWHYTVPAYTCSVGAYG